MSDDKTKTAPEDSKRINVNEPYEVQYWTERFKVSKERLIGTVEKVGPMAKDVENYLSKNK